MLRNRLHLMLTALLVAAIALAIAAPAIADDDDDDGDLDPGAPGPFRVSTIEYDFGDTAFIPTDFPDNPVEVRARVIYPRNLRAGPFPLVMFIHGNHDTCYRDIDLKIGTTTEWPCPDPLIPLPNYQGYDYVGEVLASHGYIVVSVSANGANPLESSAGNDDIARAELLQRHLEIWRTFDTTGAPPFGALFVGKVDLDNIGTMGHSKGGSAVVEHYRFNESQDAPFGIRAVFPLAPILTASINDVPLATMVSYCDGDTDVAGVTYYDAARYNVPGDSARKHTIHLLGGNHNWFNTIWSPSTFTPGSVDDWNTKWEDSALRNSHCGIGPRNGRLSEPEQQAVLVAYLTSFYRTYLGGESELLPFLTGDFAPPPSVMGAELSFAFHPPDDPLIRRDVNRFVEDSSLFENDLGGAVTQNGLSPYELCGDVVSFPTVEGCLALRLGYAIVDREPHREAARQLKIAWDDKSASYRNEIPEGDRDVSGFYALAFRAAVNFTDDRNPQDMPQDFSVVLEDGSGNASRPVPVSKFSDALYYPPGTPSFPPDTLQIPLPRLVLNTVQLPLSAFFGVDLTEVRAIEFVLDREPTGALVVTDLAFTNDVKPPAVARTCPPNIVGTEEYPVVVEDVEIRSGQSCVIQNAIVQDGNIQVSEAGEIRISNTVVRNGDIQIEKSVSAIVENTVLENGNLQVRGSGDVIVGGNRVGNGDVQVEKNENAAVEDNTASGNIQCVDNDVLDSGGNIAGGDLEGCD